MTGKEKKLIRLRINGSPVEAAEGTTVLQAAREAGITIPALCYHPLISTTGACRVCLVEADGVPVTSCTTEVSEGMEVTTNSPYIEDLRRDIIDLILSDHPYDCMVCQRTGDCELQELAYKYGIRTPMFGGERRIYEKKDGNPFIERDMEKCILCGRCTKVCDEVQGVGAIDFAYKGFQTKVCPPFERDLDCEFCGQCVMVCPTGALVGKQWVGRGRYWEIKEVDTVCSYCGTGCTITLHTKKNEVVRVTSREDTLNRGLLCVKGRFGYRFISSPDRLRTPLIKRDGRFHEASWEEALRLVAKRLTEIRAAHGPDAIGGFSSAKCTNEENFLFQKLMRAAIGTNNIDHCARLCHAPTVASLATIFGSGAMTNSIREIPGMEVIFIIGSNTKESHPVIANEMISAYRNGARIIVADPRRVPMVRFSELFLNLRPGTDVPLLNAMAHVILKEGLHNREFIEERTEGFEDWQRSVEDFTPEAAERITGVPKGDIVKAARLFAGSRRSAVFYTLGVTQHVCGTENVNAIANLALLTGSIGREFTGINPLRGQNNVQGACDAGCLPNVLPGYQRVDLPEVRQRFEDAWGVSLPPHEGMKSTELLPAAMRGDLKALYIMGENPVITDANQAHTIKALESLDFLVVQDIFMTETAELADVVLPSACFAEKDGTFTNTERRVQRVRKAVEPPGEARDDMSIIVELSALLGYPMDCSSPEDVFEEFGRLWPALAGMTYGRLGRDGLQWPCPTRDHPGTPYLYKGGFPRGKVSFTPTPYTLPEEVSDREYPFVLTTGRNLFQYHSGSMTRRVAPIEVHAGEPYMEINPADGGRIGIKDGETVRVSSRRGTIEIKARLTARIPEGVVFVPMHYREAAANVLTNDKALDSHAKTPEYKVGSVKIEKRQV